MWGASAVFKGRVKKIPNFGEFYEKLSLTTELSSILYTCSAYSYVVILVLILDIG